MNHRIITVTPNPALDVSTSVPHLTPRAKLRCAPALREAGGGGINCARVVVELGGDAQAVYAAGGSNGQLLASLLLDHDIEPTLVPAEGNTRLSFHVHVDDEDRQYRFVLPGAVLTGHAVDALLEVAETAVVAAGPGTYVIASGSLPPGSPVDLYHQLAKVVTAAGGHLVLDTAGPGLAPAARGGIAVLRNNVLELSHLVGRSLATDDEIDGAARRLIDDGAAEVVAVSLGAGGCLVATIDGIHRLAAPQVDVASTVGAGDSLTAALTLGLARGLDVVDAAAYGVAAGTAAVTTDKTELCRAGDVERFHQATRDLNGFSLL
jgi:6-phosphofructokinase 2